MICLKDVSKIYNQGKANETQALQHVTLTIKKGDMVAITGPSGSGKTTLCNLITRFWDVQAYMNMMETMSGRCQTAGNVSCGIKRLVLSCRILDCLAMIRCFEISVCRKSSLELIRKALIKKYGYCCSRLVWKDWNTKR